MTNQEFSDSFSTMLNSYGSIGQFGEQASRQEIVLDEYEKSVFLTQAQDFIVKSYFDGTLNSQGQGFDETARRQVDFSSLIKVVELTPETGTNAVPFDERGVIYQMPHTGSGATLKTKVLFILNERLLVKKVATVQGGVPKTFDETKTKGYVIKPISYREYDREMSKPYAQPLKKQAWRLLQNNDDTFNVYTELVPKFSVKQVKAGANWASGDTYFIYRIRYVERPKPIILEDLPDGLTIDGEDAESPCVLNPILHYDILVKAVELAVSTHGVYRPAEQA